LGRKGERVRGFKEVGRERESWERGRQTGGLGK